MMDVGVKDSRMPRRLRRLRFISRILHATILFPLENVRAVTKSWLTPRVRE